MVERAKELTVLLGAAVRARRGVMSVVVIEGEQGSGKTWLIDRVIPELADFDVATSSATEVPPLASESARPRVVVIDDAQWIGESVSSRVERELSQTGSQSLLVVIAARTGESSLIARLKPQSSRTERGAVITLRPFTTQQTLELASERGIDSLETARADLLAELTDGNPLHLVTAFDELGGQLHAAVPRVLPMPAGFEIELGDQLARVPAPGRHLIELLAVIGEPTAISTLVEIATRAELAISADAAVESGLVELLDQEGQRELALRSSRAREGIRRALNPAGKRTLHRAVAGSMSGWRGLDHRLAATEHTDDTLANELENEGRVLEGEGRYSDAARFFSKASGVSPNQDDRERRLLTAGTLAFYADDAELASTLAASIERCSPSVDRDLVLGGVGYLLGDFSDSLDLVRATMSVAGGDGDRADLFPAAVIASLELALVDVAGSISTSVQALQGVVEGQPLSPGEARLRITSGFALWIAGEIERSDLLLAPVLALPVKRPERADALTILGQRQFYRGDAEAALSTMHLAIESARASHALHVLPLGLALRSHIEYSLGRWDSAMVAAQGVLAHTTTSRNGNHDVLAHSVIAMISAQMGDISHAERSVRIARRLGIERPLPQHTAAAAIAAAMTERISGRPHAVVQALAPMLEGSLASGLTATGYNAWRALHAEALIELGSLDAADRVIGMFEAEPGMPYFGYAGWLRGLLAAARGDATGALAAYSTAIEAGDESQTPFAHALALRALGSAMTATGRQSDAAAHLAQADRLFWRVGATAFLAADESQNTGLAELAGWSTLTPRERDTSLLAAEGMLNREIAAAMNVTIKTVEHHMANVLAKLALRSRRDLERAAGRGSSWPSP